MLKLFPMVITCLLAAGAVTVLSLATMRLETGKFDRQTMAVLARDAPTDPATTGSIVYRDGAGLAYRKRFEREVLGR